YYVSNLQNWLQAHAISSCHWNNHSYQDTKSRCSRCEQALWYCFAGIRSYELPGEIQPKCCEERNDQIEQLEQAIKCQYRPRRRGRRRRIVAEIIDERGHRYLVLKHEAKE